jgi:serine protease Do
MQKLRLIVFGVTLFAGLGLFGLVVSRNVVASEPAEAQTEKATNRSQARPPLGDRVAGLASLQDGFIAIAERMEPSVVSLRVQKTVRTTGFSQDDFFRNFDFQMRPNMPRSFRSSGAGSGVIIRSDGWILTNDHVVENADKVTVKLHDGREFEGTVRRDFRSDLALVKIEASNLVAAEFGDSDQVRVGQWAIAFGSPFQLEDTMTLGIISARSRQQTIPEGGQARFYPSLLQTDASINPGNSGGPLVDIQGRVIGINVAINSPTGGSVGIGFAIPSNRARQIADQLITKGKVTRGFLGMAPRALRPDEKSRYRVTNGAMVEMVQEDSPASRAGMRAGDVVIRINGKPILDDINLRDMIAQTAPGSKVEIVVKRGDREQTLTATLESAPDQISQNSPDTRTEERLGIRVEAITPQNAREYRLGSRSNGVVVVEVDQGSAADEAGIERGDVIVRANDRDLRTPEDMQNVLKEVKRGDRLSFALVRGRAEVLITLTMP